ncbi:metalloprotease [Flagelloscypha sp. PMI_526]|nr:metalloprotease [Flagelloscypha sp. PMI_526]
MLSSFAYFTALALPSFALSFDPSCGSHISRDEQASIRAQFSSLTFDPLSQVAKRQVSSAEKTEVNVYWHVLYENQTFEGGYVSDQQIKDGLSFLNTNMANFSLSFNLANISRTESYEWFNYCREKESDYRDAMWAALHVGTVQDLNVYTLGFTFVPGLNGFSSFPWEHDKKPIADGVQIHYSILSGGPNSTSAGPLVHETGHWLGLFHTWQNGCDAVNDEVDDTPAEDPGNAGRDLHACPIGFDSCPGNATDPIHNFMTYASDDCRYEFTPGQRARVAQQIGIYRNLSI